jgi:oligopeptide transport system substrate-binding protein
LLVVGCTASANNETFFGKTDPPRENVLRYVSGSEPESLDPQLPIGQNEARISMALFEGLAEYDPKSSQPIPALAESWEVNKDWSEVLFHLRRDGRFSNGDPITARDFVYTIRRGMTPGGGRPLRIARLPDKVRASFNEGGVFVFDPNTKNYLLERDFADDNSTNPVALSSQPDVISSEYATGDASLANTAVHQTMHAPLRLVLPGKEKKRNDFTG